MKANNDVRNDRLDLLNEPGHVVQCRIALPSQPNLPCCQSTIPRKSERGTCHMKIIGGVIALVVLVALLKGTGGGSGSSGHHTEAASHIYLVASKSFCAPTGIDDAYTGDGHVTFYLTLRNTGAADGRADVVPVRHYDDGDINESALDEVSVDVAAGDTWQGHTEAMSYKAHAHEVTDCGVRVDGRPEVAVPAR